MDSLVLHTLWTQAVCICTYVRVVCVFTYVCRCACECALPCVCLWRREVILGCLPSLFFVLLFSKTAFFWRIWSSLISLDWLASNPYDMPVCTPQLGLNRQAIVSDFGIGARDLGLRHHAWTVVTLPVLSILLVLWVQSKIMLVLSAIS